MKFLLRYSFAAVLMISIAGSSLANSYLGAPGKLRWNTDRIEISISRQFLKGSPNIKEGSDIEGAVRNSISAWSRSSGLILETMISDKTTVSPPGVSGDGVNLITSAATPENVLLFSGQDENLSAKTRVFYDNRGFIREADIVLNPFQQFSTDGTYGTYDLETTLTHELGHLLGLRHSSVAGSMMYDVTARNGDLGLFGRVDRTISADDIAAVRELYGINGEENCCGSISGTVKTFPKNVRSADVWAENSLTGVVTAHSTADHEGSFRLGGVPTGLYRVFMRSYTSKDETSVYTLGEATVSSSENTEIESSASIRKPEFSVFALGTNGILGEGSLSFLPGGVYDAYIGGKGLVADRVSVFVTSPSVLVIPGSLSQLDYADGLDVLSFQIRIASDGPAGSFTICVADGTSADCVPGGISVIPSKAMSDEGK